MSATGAAPGAANSTFFWRPTRDGIVATLPASLPIKALGLPTRALNAFRAGGIETLLDASCWSERDLRSLPQMGPAALRTLGEALTRAGLSL
jgi:DNA-directed RNA polymerase alpha subunit